MVRKILWTALVTALTSVASGLAFRAAVTIWRRVAREEPPSQGLFKLLVRRPMKSRILALLHAPAP